MDGGKEGKLWVLVLSSTPSHRLLHCDNESGTFKALNREDVTFSRETACGKVPDPQGQHLLPSSSYVNMGCWWPPAASPLWSNWPRPMENWLTAGGDFLPPNIGTTSGHAWVIWNPSPQSCDLHLMTLSQITSLFGSFSMQFLSPSLSKGCPEGHFPQQILWTHVFTSGSAFSGALTNTNSLQLLPASTFFSLDVHGFSDAIVVNSTLLLDVVCLSFLWARSSPLGRHLTQSNPDSKTS